MKSKKSINKNKINLKVEACVHVHYDIYQSYKTYLNTNSFEYIQMYLLVVFTHILNTVDKIYARLEDPLFSIRIEFIEFLIYTNQVPELVFKKNNSYIDIVNRFYAKTILNKTISCDHTFFMHGYDTRPVKGQAFS